MIICKKNTDALIVHRRAVPLPSGPFARGQISRPPVTGAGFRLAFPPRNHYGPKERIFQQRRRHLKIQIAEKASKIPVGQTPQVALLHGLAVIPVMDAVNGVEIMIFAPSGNRPLGKKG
ncbi:MAG: hypothetical protein KAU28_08545 [Phycisphaerae bacterium]|nr:hypothetical protein [Phycisphaerae bacterium]